MMMVQNKCEAYLKHFLKKKKMGLSKHIV